MKIEMEEVVPSTKQIVRVSNEFLIPLESDMSAEKISEMISRNIQLTMTVLSKRFSEAVNVHL